MSGSGFFNPWKTYYENPAEQAAIKARAEFREAMKAEYRKKITNPFLPPRGALHDPALQRWYSARVTHAEYLQPTPKVALFFIGFFGTIGVMWSLTRYNKNKVLNKIEHGEISYSERANAFLSK